MRSIFTWFLLLIPLMHISFAQREWTLRSPVREPIDLYQVVWNGSILAAIGQNGTIMTSYDGKAWQVRQSGMSYEPMWITPMSNNFFVALGRKGAIYSTNDLASWTFRSSGTTEDLHGAAWNGKQIIVVGNAGTLLESEDGINWVKRKIKTDLNLTSILWTGTQFVVGAEGGGIFLSHDGVTWIEIISGINAPINALAASGKLVVASAGEQIFSSPDGITWNPQGYFPHGYTQAIVWTGTQFVAINNIRGVLTSPDGLVWEENIESGLMGLTGVTWMGNQSVAVGSRGSIYVSADRKTWVDQRGFQTHSSLLSVAASKDLAVAVGRYGIILTSPDGIMWTERASGLPDFIFKEIWTGTEFLAIADGGSLFASMNGTNWTDVSPSPRLAFRDLIWTKNGYLGVTDSGVVQSRDGKEWSLQKTGLYRASLLCVASNGKRNVVAGDKLLTSSNRIDWDLQSASPFPAAVFSSIACKDSICFAAGSKYGAAVFSPNDSTWLHVKTTGSYKTSVKLVESTFFVTSEEPSISFSEGDAQSWTTVPLGYSLNSVTKLGNRYIAVGDEGVIYTSESVSVTSNNSELIKSNNGLLYLRGESVSLELPTNINVTKFFLHNLKGKIFSPQFSFSHLNRLEFSSSGLEPGLYILEISGGKNKILRSILLRK